MALTQIEIETAISDSVDAIDKIVDDVWERGYPNIENRKLKEGFRLSFFLAVQEEVARKYEEEIRHVLHLSSVSEQRARGMQEESKS